MRPSWHNKLQYRIVNFQEKEPTASDFKLLNCLLLYKRGDIFELSVQTPPRALDLGTCNFNMFCAEVCRVICKNPFFDILNGSGKNPEKLICNTLKTTTDGGTK